MSVLAVFLLQLRNASRDEATQGLAATAFVCWSTSSTCARSIFVMSDRICA